MAAVSPGFQHPNSQRAGVGEALIPAIGGPRQRPRMRLMHALSARARCSPAPVAIAGFILSFVALMQR